MSGGRIRSVKPEWLDDELLVNLSSDARVLSIALLLLADDYGNGRGGVTHLVGQVFPCRPRETLENALQELIGIRYVALYAIDGQTYFSVRNWKKHQKVDRPGKPKVPAPPAGLFARPSRVSRETVATDLDLDMDMDQEVEVEPIATARFAMHPGWKPSSETVASLEVCMIPRWGIEVIEGRFRTHFAADSNDQREPAAWNQSFAKWVARDWNDPRKRPTKPEPDRPALRRAPPVIKPLPGAGPPPPDIAEKLREAMKPENMFGPQLPPERAVGDS